jgi:UPF0042 nucleotide-binding protein
MKKQLVIITGLSGSGKSTGARALEDAGYFVVDNLPMVMLPDFLELTDRGSQPVAVVVDVRSSEFLVGCKDLIEKLKAAGYQVRILFFEASDQDLVRRFSETRRRHPLMQTEGIASAIRRERAMMTELRELATAIIDSSGETVHSLRRRILAFISGSEQGPRPLLVQLQSFGFRYGLPMEADLVFDVRFLDNPHFVEELRPLSGLDRLVREFVLAQQDCQQLLAKLKDLFFFLLPKYHLEGKSNLSICIGCTGGRHRSVVIAEQLQPSFLGSGCAVEVTHRDIGKADSR